MADEQVAPSASQTTCRHSSPLRICVTCQKPKYARFSLKKREVGASRTARIFKRRNTCFSEGAAQYCCPTGIPPPSCFASLLSAHEFVLAVEGLRQPYIRPVYWCCWLNRICSASLSHSCNSHCVSKFLIILPVTVICDQ